MKRPAISRRRRTRPDRVQERGVTMILVALAMIAIIAMAALSVDVTTLYLAREESQRSADTAALAAARVLSLSGITGTADPSTDTSSWQKICGGSSSVASLTAQAIAHENAVGNVIPTVTVTYSAGTGGSSSSNADCSTLPTAFAVNPMVTVKIARTNLPTLFSRIWGRGGNSVSATATAEAFNPSNSGNVGNATPTSITPVQPRCVKPWVVPNLDPLTPGPTCTTGCTKFVDTTTGQIQRAAISLNGSGTAGTIGETFWLVADCRRGLGNCTFRTTGARGSGSPVPPQANYNVGGSIEPPPNLLYVPGKIGTPVVAIPSCTQGDAYEETIEGCDASINYQCGALLANGVDLTRNPEAPTTNGVQCLIHQSNQNDITSSSGQDSLNTFGAPSAYPFEILAGTRNPVGLSGNPISTSNSVVSLPIYDNSVSVTSGATTQVTFVGFLQVFVNAVDGNGNVNVTVLNVAGCGNGTNTTGTPVTGSSPVPVRLITPP